MADMEHQMNLNHEPFEMIKNHSKTIELRLWDEKRQKIKIGDTISFTDLQTNNKLDVEVVELHRFDSFAQLYQSLPLLKCGYSSENIDAAKPQDMERYYNIEKQMLYGVVGIEMTLKSR